jgi:hypothetical protein
MLRLPIPTGIVLEQQVNPASNAAVDHNTYFSGERVQEILYAGCFFAGSAALRQSGPLSSIRAIYPQGPLSSIRGLYPVYALDLLVRLHRKVVSRVDPCWGKLRDGPAFIRLHRRRLKALSSPSEACALAIDAMKWLNDALDGNHGDLAPEFVASEIVYMLLHAHPFVDGNGRVARALGTWVLLRAGYEPLCDLRTYCHERTDQYFAAISAREAYPSRPERWHQFFEGMVRHCFKAKTPIRSINVRLSKLAASAPVASLPDA